jgi:hypothetical protein
MAYTIDYFDPRLLTGVINKRPLKSDIFTGFFRKQSPSPVELFELHVKTRNISMPPAITNHAPGTMRHGDKVDVYTVKAPRFRPKRAFMAADKFKQPAGVNPYNPQDNALERAIAEDMDLHREELDFVLENMCCQAMVLGKITLFDLVEDNAPQKTFTVDFRRPGKHNVLLSGSALWSNSDCDLQGQLDGWDLMIQEETGFGATELLLGKNAWAAFRRHHDVEKDLDNKDIDIGHLAPRIGRKYRGTWNGLNVYVIVGTYTDLDGVVKHYLDPDYALLVAPAATSVIEFGLPVDNKCEGPVEIFAKAFELEDPSGTFTIAETRPLPWPKQPGWVVLAKVV